MNQVSGPTYLTYMIIPNFWTPATYCKSLEGLVQPTPVSNLANVIFKHLEFPLVSRIAVLLPCLISSKTLWEPLKKDGSLSTDLRVQSCTQFTRAPLLAPLIKLWSYSSGRNNQLFICSQRK